MGTCNEEYEDENFAHLKFIKRSPWFAPGDRPPDLNNVSRPVFNVMIFNDKKVGSRKIRCTFSSHKVKSFWTLEYIPSDPAILKLGLPESSLEFFYQKSLRNYFILPLH